MASKTLRHLSGIEGVSDRSLSRVLGAVKQSPELLAQPSSRCSISRQAIAAICDIGTVSHNLALTRGQPLVWEVLTLQDMLPYVCNVCPHFCQMLREVYTECGADWHAILYCDGLTPGSVLAPDNKRKSVIW